MGNVMTGTQKLIAILGCTLILTTGTATYYVVSSENETKIRVSADAVERERVGKEIIIEKEHAEQIHVLMGALEEIFFDGKPAITKGTEHD